MDIIVEKIESFMDLGGTKKDITFIVVSAIALVFSLFEIEILPFDAAWIAIILCGVPIIVGAIIGLVTAFDIKADVLVALALIASVCIGQDFAAGEVAVIMQLGALLEDLTVAKARAGIEKLVHLTPQTARVVDGDTEIVIAAEDVTVDALLRVLPGETIPVDGVIVKGTTSINESVMTGESLPVDKMVGDNVSSGTVNQFGVFEMRATKVGQDSSIQRMIRLVQSADAGKANIVRLADRWATWIVVTALTAAAFTWLVTGEIIRAVTILVVFCPCALVLATPTAIMAAIGNATKHGFLVSEGDALERLAKVSKITFDKTGTLTYGKPQVNMVTSTSSYTEQDIYKIAASVEQLSEHPLGKAIVQCFKATSKESLFNASRFEMIPGAGITAVCEGKTVKAGTMAHVSADGVSHEIPQEAATLLDEGCTFIYLAIDDELAGYVVLSDTLREDSKATIEKLRTYGVEPVLMTGDNEKAAHYIAREVSIDTVYARCLPEDKLNHVSAYQESNELVCMIGDGINDAPALKKAHVGIAMAGVGSDIAIEAADIALVDDEIKELPHLVALSKRMMKTITLNLSFSMGLNFLAITLAMLGIMGPVVGALVHNAGSVAVIINSAFLLNWKDKSEK